MAQTGRIGNKKRHAGHDNDDEKKLSKLRETVNHMYFIDRIARRAVARKLGVSRTFVMRWTASPDQDFSSDMRGWTKGVRRKWDSSAERRIREIYNHLAEDPRQFYTGATAIAQEWRIRYPGSAPPPLRTIGKIMSDLGLASQKQRSRRKGASRYLCYPEHTVYNHLGKRVLEADFIGKKYITGRSEPVNFIGFSFKKEPRLRYFRRIEGQTAANFIRECSLFFERFEKPDCVKVDNGSAVMGSVWGKRNISRAMDFLLRNRIYPVFAPLRKPFSQASIEGNNSVFSRKFWNRIVFSGLEEIDEKLEWFNEASLRYTGYESSVYERENVFIPRIYFIRQVREDESTKDAYIEVLNDRVRLPSAYTNFFVLAQWNVTDDRIAVHIEKDEVLETIEEALFPVNKKSRKRYPGW